LTEKEAYIAYMALHISTNTRTILSQGETKDDNNHNDDDDNKQKSADSFSDIDSKSLNRALKQSRSLSSCAVISYDGIKRSHIPTSV
jgi:hypothetical protein